MPPPRAPTFCTGCPERPVFGAMKLVEKDIGKVHYAADIGCHAFATFAPFHFGNSILGYGMSLASNAGVGPIQEKRTIAVMGDGGFWHNGVQTGVATALHNKSDGVLVIMQNGYASATGQQWLPSSGKFTPEAERGMDIERHLKAMGVSRSRRCARIRWPRWRGIEGRADDDAEGSQGHHRGVRVHARAKAARERGGRQAPEGRQARREGPLRRRRQHLHGRSLVHPHVGLPVADGQAEPRSAAHRSGRARQQRLRRLRVVRGDGARRDPVPDFYRAQRTINAGWWERALHRMRRAVIGRLARGLTLRSVPGGGERGGGTQLSTDGGGGGQEEGGGVWRENTNRDETFHCRRRADCFGRVRSCATVDKLGDYTVRAALRGAKLVVFPEAFVGGYPKGLDFGARVGMRTPAGREYFRLYYDGAIDVPGPPSTRLGEIAAANDVHLVIGVIERDGGTLYCTVLFFAPDGRCSASTASSCRRRSSA